jgi:ribulose-phosphate 3-epimerase
MGVNPGFGGQSFIPQTLEKIKQLKKLIAEKKANTLIEIDGGVTLDNAAEMIGVGADILVAGNTVFNSPNPIGIISRLCHV